MNVRLAPLLILFVVLAAGQTLIAQDSSFILKTTALQPYFPTYLGNGWGRRLDIEVVGGKVRFRPR